MPLFYKVPRKKILEIRNAIFLENGIPPLLKNGFEKSPFSTAWFGKGNFGGFSYELCKLDLSGDLIVIKAYILSNENWIQIFLNIFRPEPRLELNGIEGLKYSTPPNSETSMRLRIDDRKGPPILHIFEKQHKLSSFHSESGLKRSIQKLSELIKADMTNIGYFVDRWHEMHGMTTSTTWEGMPVS